MQRMALPAFLLAVMTTWGCARHSTCCRISSSNTHAEDGLPIVERTPIIGTIDDARLRAADALLPSQREYRGITALEAQCLAVEASAIGNLLDQERSSCGKPNCGLSCGCEQSVQLAVLRHAGAEARNKNGADALKLYYGIAEAEAGLDAAALGLQEIDEVQRQISDVRRQDLTIPFDASQWDRQRSSLTARQVDMKATRATLNAKLRAILGFAAAPDAPLFLPTEELRLLEMTLDREVEVAYGLQAKPELAALRSLMAADRESTDAAAKALLGDVHGLMGVASRTMLEKSLNSLLGVTGKDADLRRGQIRSFYERRAGQLAGDIRAAVEVIELRGQQAVANQAQVDSRLRRIDELTQRHETAQATFVELAEARVRLIEERMAVTSAVIGWKRAIVDLRELQGALVAQCRGGCIPPEPMPAVTSERVPTLVEPLPPPLRGVNIDGEGSNDDEDLESLAAELGFLEPLTYPTTPDEVNVK